jgi:hypothetical protein
VDGGAVPGGDEVDDLADGGGLLVSGDDKSAGRDLGRPEFVRDIGEGARVEIGAVAGLRHRSSGWLAGLFRTALSGKRDPIQTKILTERVLGVFDDLLGKAAWSPPRDSGLVFAFDNKEGTADHSRQL